MKSAKNMNRNSLWRHETRSVYHLNVFSAGADTIEIIYSLFKTEF